MHQEIKSVLLLPCSVLFVCCYFLFCRNRCALAAMKTATKVIVVCDLTV